MPNVRHMRRASSQHASVVSNSHQSEGDLEDVPLKRKVDEAVPDTADLLRALLQEGGGLLLAVFVESGHVGDETLGTIDTGTQTRREEHGRVKKKRVEAGIGSMKSLLACSVLAQPLAPGLLKGGALTLSNLGTSLAHEPDTFS